MQQASAGNVLFFIPDISGFTKFVAETEINHSQHIIKALLETLFVRGNMLVKLMFRMFMEKKIRAGFEKSLANLGALCEQAPG